MNAPLLIAHRGASGHLPEHTLPAYALAVLQGADFIEPDLVATRDGVLVARHENEIGATTDVASHPEFAARRRTQVIDGRVITGWFTEDFTWEELQRLRARERIPALRPANTRFDGQFGVPSLADILRFLATVNAARADAGRAPVGVYPETKHPAHFRSKGLPLEPPLLAALDAQPGATPVFIQSFEAASLRLLRGQCGHPLVQLLGEESAGAVGAEALRDIAGHAQAVGPHKSLLLDPASGAPSGFIARAHDAGLAVHAWTFRAENEFLPVRFRSGGDPAAAGDLAGEIAAYVAAGVDGLFCDQPGAALLALQGLASGSPQD